MPITLTEIDRETYGNDERAINRHHDRTFCTAAGRRYMLSRTLDAYPPFFEAYGPYGDDHVGMLPRLRVDGSDYWGDGLPWSQAMRRFRAAVEAHEGALSNPTKH